MLRWRRLWIGLFVAGLAILVPSYASAQQYVETAGYVQAALESLKTTDGQPIRDADCRPQGQDFAMLHSQLNGSLWTCYVSDGLSRVYNVVAHLRDTQAGGLDRVTVLNCWRTYSNFPCPAGPTKIVVATAASSQPTAEGEDLALIQHQLLKLKTSDGIRIRQAACRPLGSSWFTGARAWIYASMWTCYLSDGISRVYNVNAHVQNSKTGDIDRLTVLNCWPTWARFTCPRGPAKIVLPVKTTVTAKKSGPASA
jgi:hypothetical protein